MEPGRIERIAREIAARMGVTGYRVTVGGEGNDERPGSAYAVPSTGEIHISMASARALSDDELVSVLAHEFAHLVVGEPWALRVRSRLPLPVVASLLGAVLGAGFALLTPELPADWVPLPLWVALTALCGGLVGYGMDHLWRASVSRRLELECDVERAHAVGAVGLSAFRFDPALRSSRLDRPFNTHPRTGARVQAIMAHRMRECGCPARPVQVVGSPSR